MHAQRALPIVLIIAGLAAALFACGGGAGGTGTATRSFLMGTTPFFATATAFPDWRMENLGDKDLLSIHVDDFWGVPWEEFRDGAQPPSAWLAKWTTLADSARATGKTLYLAVSPLGDRKTLAPKVDSRGNPVARWAPVDGHGCYPFATDTGASGYKTAYINYLIYVIALVQPKYLSPAIEMNVPFSQCAAADKAAWIAWYADVHDAIKQKYPALIVFPTFQMEHLYGISDARSACPSGTSAAACFDQRLAEALTIPGDRIAFSTYPIAWKYSAAYSFNYPTDSYARIQQATTRKIWVSETGWAAVKVLQSYPHGGVGSCGAELQPAAIADDTQQGAYMAWLLSEAQARGFETVIWWLNRDYLDGGVAATCPCSPATSDTCQLADTFFAAEGSTGETFLRLFGNMALRDYHGGPRPALVTWQSYSARPLSPVP